MRLKTHNLFAWGVLCLTAAPFLKAVPSAPFFAKFLLWLSLLAASAMVNRAMDRCGHRWVVRRDGVWIPRRSAKTHSLRGAIILGFLLLQPFAALMDATMIYGLSAHTPAHAQPAFEIVVLWASAASIAVGCTGMLVALSHLFLDSLTEGGIYRRNKPKREGAENHPLRRRWALAHYPYDSCRLNGFFALLGLALALIASPLSLTAF